jgi:hypothetical protein
MDTTFGSIHINIIASSPDRPMKKHRISFCGLTARGVHVTIDVSLLNDRDLIRHQIYPALATNGLNLSLDLNNDYSIAPRLCVVVLYYFYILAAGMWNGMRCPGCFFNAVAAASVINILWISSSGGDGLPAVVAKSHTPLSIQFCGQLYTGSI